MSVPENVEDGRPVRSVLSLLGAVISFSRLSGKGERWMDVEICLRNQAIRTVYNTGFIFDLQINYHDGEEEETARKM